MLNASLVGPLITLAAVGCVYRAYSIYEQFFPTCMYLMKSNFSMMVLVSFCLYCLYLAALLTSKVLFGSLRLIESEHLQEYGWLTVSESFLAMTIFRDEFDARFVLLFSSLLVLKAFHWIARDRVDFMEQTAQLPSFFNPRMLTTIMLMVVMDSVGLFLCTRDVILRGPSMSILFGNECALLIVSLVSIIVRYALNIGDIRRGGVWEYRSIFLFYYDFVVDLAKLLIYSVFFGIIVKYYGVPLHIIRDMYITLRSFIIRIKDIIRYRKATANMDERYPEATPEELAQSDGICIICREEMTSAKRLPCGHLFHFRCLRSWLERQQACPTCRRSILNDDDGDANGMRRNNRHAPNDANNNAPPNDNAGAAPPRQAWRNGGWEPLNNNPPNPQPQARPAVIYPHIQETLRRIPQSPEMAQISGEIIPGPFGAVPVILIPPQQLAAVQGLGELPHPRPRAPLTPDPRGAQGGEQRVPPYPARPHSASPTTPTDPLAKDLNAPLYQLKSSDGQLANIYLEPIGGDAARMSSSHSYSVSSLPSSAYQSQELNRPDRPQVLDEETRAIRESIRRQLRRELSSLSQLQLEVSSLTERLLEAEARLESTETLDPASLKGLASPGSGDEDVLRGKEKATGPN